MNNTTQLAAHAIILSWVVFIGCLILPWIQPDYSYITPWYVFYFFSCFLLFYSFFILGTQLHYRPVISISHSTLCRFALLILIIAVLCRAIDKLYLRDVHDLLSISSVRASRKGDSNIFSVLAAILTPLALVGWKIAGERSKQAHIRLLSAGLVVVIVLDVVISGSRGTLLVICVLLMGKALNKKNLIFLLPALVIFSSLFFLWRFNSLQGHIDIAPLMNRLATDGYSKFVPASPWFTSLLEDGGWLSILLFSFLQAAQYLTHGFFEFAYLFETGPQFQFDPSMLIPHLTKLLEVNAYVERKNLYYTIFGTLFIGFGYFSIVVGSMLGFCLGALYNGASRMSIACRNLIILSLFLTPFVNSFGGYDIYLYLAAIYFYSILRIKHPMAAPPSHRELDA